MIGKKNTNLDVVAVVFYVRDWELEYTYFSSNMCTAAMKLQQQKTDMNTYDLKIRYENVLMYA